MKTTKHLHALLLKLGEEEAVDRVRIDGTFLQGATKGLGDAMRCHYVTQLASYRRRGADGTYRLTQSGEQMAAALAKREPRAPLTPKAKARALLELSSISRVGADRSTRLLVEVIELLVEALP